MPEIPLEQNNCESEGIMSTVAGIAGALQAHEVINTILNNKNVLNGKMLFFDGLKLEFRKIKLSRSSKCIQEGIRK
jgi:molybdopterin/thiamine biosynthesis adenylyltransferase